MSWQFYNTSDPGKPAHLLVKKINEHLARDHKVLWLLSGGSAIEVATRASGSINQPLENLTITLVDERYGPAGHPDSNATQLTNAGFDLKFRPVLTGQSLADTAEHFNSWLEEEFKKSDYKIALLGIGGDGHTSGILPGSPAIKSKELACAFRGPDFERVTTTARALALLDAAVVYSVGEAKWPELSRLEQPLTVEQQPAQILKKIPDVALFNDYKGDKI